jgi:hypothetical protein
MSGIVSRVGMEVKYSFIQFSMSKQSIFFTLIFPIIRYRLISGVWYVWCCKSDR